MKKIWVVVILLVANSICFSNLEKPIRFPQQMSDLSYYQSFILKSQNCFLFFWVNERKIQFSKSCDDGLTWQSPIVLQDSVLPVGPSDTLVGITALVTNTGRVLVVWKNLIKRYHYQKYSDDNGLNWSSQIVLPTGTNPFMMASATHATLSQTFDGKIWLTFSAGGYAFSVNDGNDWVYGGSTFSGTYSTVLSIDSSKLIVVYQSGVTGNGDIYTKISTDGGQDWHTTIPVISSTLNEVRPRVIRESNCKLWIFYQLYKNTPFTNFKQSDIFYTASTNGGITWSTPSQVTKFVGFDGYHNVSLSGDSIFISFASERTGNNQLYYGLVGVTDDNNSPPYLYYSTHIPNTPAPSQPVSFRAYVDDDPGIPSVYLKYSVNYMASDSTQMYDDGLNGDSLANDKIYGVLIGGFNSGDVITYKFSLNDSQFNHRTFNGSNILVPLTFGSSQYLIDINRFKLPMNNSGVFAAVTINGESGGKYDGNIVLFSGGFYLSGKSNNNLWANAVASSSRLQDYWPGKVGSLRNDPKNVLYVIKSSDPHFGDSWQNWKFAVKLGAGFYDGNNDGVYNPVDINGNGVWDINEDRPDLIGHVTTWCVFNDGVASDFRRFSEVQPQGLEIHQTVFASGPQIVQQLDDIIFIRYRLINRGTVADVMDSVYFGVWSDPDIGDYSDDLAGCDTTLNSGFVYNHGIDTVFGGDPPAISFNFLQGPYAYIPGKTFLDNNGNGIYDLGTDTPLDSAYNHKGPYMRIDTIPGAMNLMMTSFIHFLCGHSTMSGPNNGGEARNFMLGLDRLGNSIDPCSWSFGSVLGGVNCATISRKFLYSGDPVSNYGWINNYACDQRILLSTGPFRLETGKPVDIITAYVVGRGTDPLNSVVIVKNTGYFAKNLYNNNFDLFQVSVREKKEETIASYKLFQNYPNPFNPTTNIKFALPEVSIVTVEVYNLLGQKVKTMINEERPAGYHIIEWDGRNKYDQSVGSGVYLFRISAEGNSGKKFTQARKMVLLH